MTVPPPLRVLIVEDSADDAMLLRRELQRSLGSIESRQVDTAETFRAALQAQTWDLVLSDHRMPSFSSTQALALLQEAGLDIPFIIVSGAIGAEVAVAAMKAGASDFLPKGDLTRLAPAITRELREAKIRAEREAAVAALQALEVENARVVAASRVQAQFLASVSHELRTPLNAIIGFSDLFVAGTIGPLDASQIEIMQLIQQSGHQLLRLIDDLLDLARVEAGKMSVNCQPCDLTQLCDEAIKLLQPIAIGKELRLALDTSEQVPLAFADPGRLRQVLFNLVANAMKFTRAGGSVTVRCHAIDASRVRTEVIDTGVGIAPDELSRLFVPFVRLHNADAVPGTGLGLALAKPLVVMMGGELGVVSKLGVGSTFYVDLPVVTSSHAQP